MIDEVELALGKLVDLTRDWARYGELASEEWRDEMRRALVVEMRYEVDRLARACGMEER